MKHAAIETAAAAALLFAVIVGLQWLAGAYQSELAANADEAAHYVTGLMVRDYVAAGVPGRAMEFAKNFYLHYPKVALGHWPPLFYVVEAGWMLLLGVSRTSVLLLMAVLGTLLAVTLYREARAEFGTWAGLACGLLMVCLPVMQAHTATPMADVPVTLLILWAAWMFRRYLETGAWQDAAGFGILASLAILTKGTGLCLALLPPLALLLTRRWRWLRRPSLWLSAAVVVPLCAPWYLVTNRMVQSTWFFRPGLAFTGQAVFFNLKALVALAGAGVFAAALCGLYAEIIEPLLKGREVPARWAVAGALLASVLLFQSVAPAGLEPRFLMPAVPPLVMLMAAGVRRLGAGWVLAAALALLFALGTFTIGKRERLGFDQAAADLLARPEFNQRVLLVCSDAEGEGAFISEVAMRERRPNHIILRANKALAQVGWTGEGFRLRYQSAEEAMRFLDEAPVSAVVLDAEAEARGARHALQLRGLIQQRPERWKLLGRYGGRVQVYHLAGNESRPVGRIRIDMRTMLGTFIEK